MRGVFTYLNCWELLRESPKWSNVPSMTTTGRRKAKQSKTSSSVDPETPTSDARNVYLNINLDDEDEEVELARPPVRRSGKKEGKAELSSANFEMKQDFEEMNRHLQDIRDLGHRRFETMQERNAENKKICCASRI
ncbi:putative No apical meristem-associated domain-containing protein [Helianthus annuus]|nr:putative No apical meristem-associated domain-containing protein [Helianthus annuus]